ncbi:hypothetical protein GDO81_016295 [Engystomops pustulosus]|uniref:Uncharacterized protein n=1 Tax=Engystomops pustulosus TaxID=76066 RepID=A0AAV7AXF1_ENGPU|nr:hypothetical protein GDO81_016295 [Engystomops pustulosus]
MLTAKCLRNSLELGYLWKLYEVGIADLLLRRVRRPRCISLSILDEVSAGNTVFPSYFSAPSIIGGFLSLSGGRTLNTSPTTCKYNIGPEGSCITNVHYYWRGFGALVSLLISTV